MTQPSPELRALISESLANRQQPAQTGDAVISVSDECCRLLQVWPDSPSQTDLKSLHALCRKVHLAKSLFTTYQDGWKKYPDAMEFQTRDWELLASVLAVWSTPRGSYDFENISLGAKCLNALLDLIQRWQLVENVPNIQCWEQYAKENLQAWFSSRISKEAAA